MRLFSLLPVAGFIPQHIQIDTAALRQLLRTGVLGQVYVPGDQSVFFRDADDWWRRAFNVDKCTSANRRFAYYISTNGVKASVHVSVTRRPRPAVNDYGYTFTQPSEYVGVLIVVVCSAASFRTLIVTSTAHPACSRASFSTCTSPSLQLCAAPGR